MLRGLLGRRCAVCHLIFVALPESNRPKLDSTTAGPWRAASAVPAAVSAAATGSGSPVRASGSACGSACPDSIWRACTGAAGLPGLSAEPSGLPSGRELRAAASVRAARSPCSRTAASSGAAATAAARGPSSRASVPAASARRGRHTRTRPAASNAGAGVCREAAGRALWWSVQSQGAALRPALPHARCCDAVEMLSRFHMVCLRDCCHLTCSVFPCGEVFNRLQSCPCIFRQI